MSHTNGFPFPDSMRLVHFLFFFPEVLEDVFGVFALEGVFPDEVFADGFFLPADFLRLLLFGFASAARTGI